ncbi:DUF1566 domain-containing protein [Sulfurovum sp. CS9]|uniref:Lcl domain-containing protein n=1 Tax=Sulfurovum sp. CS9 TaxID=3391146 RepID=UPI0039EA5FF8
MRKIIIFTAMFTLVLFADPVLRTGQILSYGQYSSDTPVPLCSVKDDGCYRAGEEFNYTRSSIGIVTDHVTNLEWQDTSIKNRDWYGSIDHCSALTLDGSGWRLPTIRELESLINYSKAHNPVDDIFQSIPGGNYWSSTPSKSDNSEAWIVRFQNWGYSLPIDKTNDIVETVDPETNATSYTYYYARCVRGQSYGNSDFHRSNNIVTDRATGLEWQDDLAAKTVRKNWIGAINYCEGLTLGSYTDWRLPNQKELLSIADRTRYYPTIDTTVFQNCATYKYWSSTTRIGHPITVDAWFVNFRGGVNYYDEKNSTVATSYVRCVRENIPPTADAGPNEIVEVKEAITITGSGSDTDGTVAAYEWKKGDTVLAATASFDYTPTSVGTDTLTLIVTDDDGATDTDSMTITAVDTTSPDITLNGDNPMEVVRGSTFTDPGAIATDNVDGDVPVSVSGTVDTSTVGTYTLTYSATDAAGNAATETRTVHVVDIIPPIITLNGTNPMDIVEGSTFTDPGAIATDDVDGDVPVSVSGTVDTSIVGTYTLTYSATDAAGNDAATETRTVHVVAKAPDWCTVSPDGNTYTATSGSKVASSDGFDDIEVSEDKITFKADCLTIEMKSNGEIITGYQSGCSAKAGLTVEGVFAPGTKVSVQSDGSIIIDAPLASDLVLGGI